MKANFDFNRLSESRKQELDHMVKLLFSAFAQTVKIKISFHNLISFHRASRSLRCRAKCLL